jgi:hypothetical protein
MNKPSRVCIYAPTKTTARKELINAINCVFGGSLAITVSSETLYTVLTPQERRILANEFLAHPDGISFNDVLQNANVRNIIKKWASLKMLGRKEQILAKLDEIDKNTKYGVSVFNRLQNPRDVEGNLTPAVPTTIEPNISKYLVSNKGGKTKTSKKRRIRKHIGTKKHRQNKIKLTKIKLTKKR